MPAGAPAPPFQVRAWADAAGTTVLLRWMYEAFEHGWELPFEYAVHRLR